MIVVKDLTQVYKSGKGVFDLSFNIQKGEVFGYLGPNGAGKTTTIRNLLGFANANKGYATINGMDCRKDSHKLQKNIGYLPGEIAFFDNMTGKEFLDFMSDMRKSENQKKRKRLIDLFELETEGKIKKMSKGMKQKLAVITAFMHDPELYILDEPTNGLDPLMQNAFMTLLENEKARGKTIMMSSHIFEEIEKICDRAGIIKDGKIVSIEDVTSLKKIRKEEFIITLDKTDKTNISFSGLEHKKIDTDRYIIYVQNDYSEFFRVLSELKVIKLETKKQSLEDIFMKYYGKAGGLHE